jgi:LysM repeat protein
MAKNDIVAQTIQKQIALNSGDISISTAGSGAQWVNSSTGTPISTTGDATGFVLSNLPPVYPSKTSTAQIYNYAQMLFSGANVPTAATQVMANLATYYVNQSGDSVQSIYNNGVLSSKFLASINTLRAPGSQIGYTLTTLIPNWTNNPILAPNLLAVT